jgi:CheY-like chemotaxis protein
MPSPKKYALVVDDDVFMRADIKKVLAKFDYEIIEAINGRSGVEKFKKQKFDLVTMDFMMPELNGAQAASEIRKLDKNIFIIGLSSSYERMKSACEKLGLNIPVLSKFEMPEILTNFIRELYHERDAGKTEGRSQEN